MTFEPVSSKVFSLIKMRQPWVMARFSERYGYTSVRDTMQLKSIDKPLRNGLWSVFYETVARDGKSYKSELIKQNSVYHKFLEGLWKRFYKYPMDTFFEADSPESYNKSLEFVRNDFYRMKWFKVYNFLELAHQHLSYDFQKERFMESCNEMLKQEMASYRFVKGEIVQITSDEEIAEIEQAIGEVDTNPVSLHLKRALELLSDKTEPDFRNSIKESISAVEALCVNLTGATTLGQALKKLDADRAIKTHTAINKAFQQLYGYTSDAGGIRHALLEEDSLEFEDAKFMLVSCSAFVNYLQAKVAKKS